MRSGFDQQLALLNQQLTIMGALCEEAIARVAKVLDGEDPKIMDQLGDLDKQIDQMERSIEALCLKLLLQQQPVARDLRQISAALKMITDMERIGDQAEDIAEILAEWKRSAIPVHGQIYEMARAASKMVTDSIDAYVKQDLQLAQAVVDYDDVVDSDFCKVKNSLIEAIAKEQAEGEAALDLLMIAKYFERIGDHATNIAEWVQFSISGHHAEDQA